VKGVTVTRKGSNAAGLSRLLARALPRRIAAAAVLVCAASTALTACSALPKALEASGPWQAGAGGNDLTASTRVPPATSVLAGTAPDALTAALAARLFGSAPVVVVAADTATAVNAAEQDAMTAHAPVLLTAATVRSRGKAVSTATVSAALLTEINDLHPRAVLAVGVAPATLEARLPGVQVVSQATSLPPTGPAAPLSSVAVLVDRAKTAGNAALAAVTTTARVAGATVVTVNGYDPRADRSAIEALAKAKPREVVAIGSGFGPASRLAARVAVAETGVQLPGGGQVLFPGHRLVALYGSPGTPALGVLGDQDLTASIARARASADLYRPLSKVPVVPTFEIIATVAQGSAGPDGMYSYVTPVADIAPWVHAASAAGMYVILDLQPGRANLLDQAKVYQSLLTLPNVGLALDPEWKLQPGQLPLRQIGSVSITEVNSVVDWLAALTASHHLPQKLLVLHQFRLSSLLDESQLDTRNDDLAIVIHMDGQGTPGEKQQTWDAVTAAAPPKVFFGWKNFLVKDHPMISPQATMAETPTPVMISYQ
jgi:hypothetical protein